MIRIKCKTCKKDVYCYLCQLPRKKFCSKVCLYKHNARKQRGVRLTNKQKQKISNLLSKDWIVKCANCGDSFIDKYKKNRKYCSSKCFYEKMEYKQIDRYGVLKKLIDDGIIIVNPSKGEVFVTRHRRWRMLCKPKKVGCLNKIRGYVTTAFVYRGKEYGFKIHQIIWFYVFGIPPIYMDLAHKDDDKLNNSINNLHLVTHEQNIKDAIKNGRIKQGSDNPSAKLNYQKAEEIRKIYKNGLTMRELAIKYNVAISTVSDVINRKKWYV